METVLVTVLDQGHVAFAASEFNVVDVLGHISRGENRVLRRVTVRLVRGVVEYKAQERAGRLLVEKLDESVGHEYVAVHALALPLVGGVWQHIDETGAVEFRIVHIGGAEDAELVPQSL